jgi:hypothetical protein
LDKISAILPDFIKKFVPLACEMVLLTLPGEQYSISWSGIKEKDDVINSMKAKSLQFISLILQYEGTTTIKDAILIEQASKIVNHIIANLKYFIVEKVNILIDLDTDGETYETLIFQSLLFLSRLLTREPIITHFTPMAEK